ncbi:MAG TPA: serine hydrolase domain-containing protein [Thermoanaerobaculia bacterium]|nr:serine hydrolase domain-containing protein [Thermoanaerobaculia bacterium]
MHSPLRGIAALLLGLLTLASPAFALAGSTNLVSTSIDDLFSRLTAYGFSGSVLVARHGEVLLRKGYGLADHKAGVPVEPDTAFDLGSITKQFTAAAILRLEMEGKLSTSDRLGTYLPAIAKHVGLAPAPGQVREEVAGITLHQLLSHTSGLDNLYLDQSPSWQEYLAKILAQTLLAPPGQEFHYSNTGYDLLAMIVEVVSGVPYERYLREHLLLPAGLVASTGFDLPAWRRERIARYQDWTTREWPFPVEMPLDRPPRLRLSGSGGMLSTVDDLYRWHQALLGDRILSAAAREKLYHPVLDSYAYGWRIGTTARGTRVISHGGFDTSLGVSAGFYRYVDDDVVVIVLANTNMNRQLNMEIVSGWVEGLLFGGVVPMPPPAAASSPLPSLAGHYTLPTGGDLEILWRGGQLVAAANAPEGILLLALPDALAAEAPEDERMTHIFRGIDKGDWEPLRAALWADASFEGLKRRTAGWWELQRKELGSFVSVRPVHEVWRLAEGSSELQVFLLLRFERGLRLVRAIRNPAGRYLFNVENVPERIELPLAPQAADTYSAWSLRFQTGPRLVFDSTAGTVKILGRRAVTVAKRAKERN